MKRFKYYLIAITFLLPSVLFSQDETEEKLLKQFHTITSEEMMTWVEKLCSPEFAGRLTGTPGFMASAEWVAGELKSWGIKPGGDNSTYFQWFDAPYTEVNDIGSLSLILTQNDGSIVRKNYNYPDDYYPGMNSGNG